MCKTIHGMCDVKESYVTMLEAVEYSHIAGGFGNQLHFQFTAENQCQVPLGSTLDPSVLPSHKKYACSFLIKESCFMLVISVLKYISLSKPIF